MARVLITGATGFIGNHVTRLALERGDTVRVMVMPGEDRSPLHGMEVEIVEGNVLDPESLQRAVSGVEQLYHLAALFAIWTRDPNLHYKINVDGAQHMMQAALAAGVEKVVYTSSVAAIGIPGGGELANEQTRFNGWPWASDYILSKFISHHVVKGLVADGLPATLVLPGLPFGPGDRAPTPTGTMVLRTLQGKMKNYWQGGVPAVDVRDVAAGHILAMDKGGIGESYILSNRDGNYNNRDLLRLIGEIAGVPDVATREVSAATMIRVAKIAEFVSKITGRAPVTTLKNTMYVLQQGFMDPGKAIAELGLPQTPLETAIRDSVEWFRANNYV